MRNHRFGLRVGIAAVMAVAAVTAGGAPAGSANLPCVTRATSAYLSAWGDTNQYFVAPSGTLEGGLTGWSLSGQVSSVAINEPWKVVNGTHARSMQLAPYSRATSQTFCVAPNEDAVRLFYRSPGVAGSGLLIKLTVSIPNSTLKYINTYVVSGNQYGWLLTNRIDLPDMSKFSSLQYLTVEVSPTNTQATWLVDDVLVDPWRAK